MFTKEINSLTLMNDVADRLFDNIAASNYGFDKTFEATLRAVLHGRLPAGESVSMSIIPVSHDVNAISFMPHDMVMKGIADSIAQNGIGYSYAIYVVYPKDKHAGTQLLDIARANAGAGKRYFDAYVAQEDLRVYYARKFGSQFYTNNCSTIIFLDRLDTRIFHAVQTMIPRYLPRLFEGSPLSGDEIELLKSLCSNTPGEYERLIEQFSEKLDMRREIIITRLKGFEMAYERERVQQVTEVIETHQQEYQTLLHDLRRTVNTIQEQQIILAGLQCRIDGGGDSELMDYFICNKNLSLIRVNGTELEFVVHGYADIYDEDAFDTYAGNLDSCLYSDINGSLSKVGMQGLYRAIFRNGAYRLRMCAAYRVDMRNSIKPVMDYVFPAESQTYLPNPHIQNFGCIGGYAIRFAEYMNNRDYLGAIDQAAVSARNLNFHDSPVMKKLATALFRTNIKCVEDAAGNLMTPREAIKKLEEEVGEWQSR